MSNMLIKTIESVRIPGYKIYVSKSHDTKSYKSVGLLYYIMVRLESNSKQNINLRFTSKTNNFNEIYSIDICNNKLVPDVGNIIQQTYGKQEIENLLYKMCYPPKSILQKLLNHSNVSESFETDMKIMKWTNKLLLGLQVVAAVFMAVSLVIFGVKKIIKWRSETTASTSAEQDINDKLFSKQDANEPAFLIYHKLISFLKTTIDGTFPAVILCGKPGTSKTYIVKRTLYFMGKKPGRDYSIEKGGTLGLLEVYGMLYKNRDKILVLDDFDTPLKTDDMINLLKSITDSYDRRIVSVPTNKMMNSDGKTPEFEFPSKFEFTGKIIIITNLPRTSIDTALVSRCPTISVDFSPDEMIKAIDKMMVFIAPSVPMEVKKEVYEYCISLVRKNPRVEFNFRVYQNCVSARQIYPTDWQDMCRLIMGIDHE